MVPRYYHPDYVYVYLLEIESCRVAKEAAKAAEERKKMVIIGDMQPLADALPNLTVATCSSVSG